MSEEFEVRAPHEDLLDEEAAREPRGMAGQVAVMTAVLATVAAMFSYMAGATQAEAGLLKNDAAIKKTEASNQWNYYQAKGNKLALDQLAIELAPASRRSFFEAEIKRYDADKETIRKAAEKFESESLEADKASGEQMHRHHRWAQATTVLQVAIATAAIALLTRRRWLEKFVVAVGGIGLVLGGMAWFHV
ncbi:MAG: rane protein [Rhizobacter sp.]|nr:rane protein [Rhizobacter sp.]